MDPWIRLWLYEHWLLEQENEMEKARSHAILVGSFTNPEAAQKMIKKDKPDFSSTEEEVQESIEMMKEINARADASAEAEALLKHRRRKRKVLKE